MQAAKIDPVARSDDRTWVLDNLCIELKVIASGHITGRNLRLIVPGGRLRPALIMSPMVLRCCIQPP